MKFNSHRTSIVLTLLVVAFAVGATHARADHRSEAHKHFTRALELIQEEAYEQAVVEFRRAYDISPHYFVLYNIGMAYVAIGKPIEAFDTLTKYLRDGGKGISTERRTQVQQEIKRQKARIAFLRIEVKKPGATIRVDGEDRGISPLNKPIRVGIGTHNISVVRDGYRTATTSVVLAGEEEKNVALELKPIPAENPTERVGQLDVRCPVPDVRIEVDGKPAGQTPLPSPVLVPLGDHQIAFRREGYTPIERSITVRSSRVVPIECAIKPLSPLPAIIRSTVLIDVSEPNASVVLDGTALAENGQVPSGEHQLEVKRSGFKKWKKKLTLNPRQTRKVKVRLIPKSDYLRDYQSDAQTVRILAYVLGAAGVAVGGLTIGLYAWNDSRYSD